MQKVNVELDWYVIEIESIDIELKIYTNKKNWNERGAI